MVDEGNDGGFRIVMKTYDNKQISTEIEEPAIIKASSLQSTMINDVFTKTLPWNKPKTTVRIKQTYT